MNLRETQAAEKLGVAVQTLRNWRHVRRGPAYIKFGRNVRYREEDLLDYIDKHRIDPNSA
jgi:predicted site-specific integrase-resolvase